MIECRNGYGVLTPGVSGVSGYVKASKRKFLADIKLDGARKLYELLDSVLNDGKYVSNECEHLAFITAISILNKVGDIGKPVKRIVVDYDVPKLKGDAFVVLKNGSKIPLLKNPTVLLSLKCCKVLVLTGGVDGRDEVKVVGVYLDENLRRFENKVSLIHGWWPVRTFGSGVHRVVSAIAGVSPKGNFVVIPKVNEKYFSVKGLLSRLDVMKRPRGVRFGVLDTCISGDEHEVAFVVIRPGSLWRSEVVWTYMFEGSERIGLGYGDVRVARRQFLSLFGGEF